jgi:hypothetical protein
MISRLHDIIFVHIPKTAGNALQGALLPFADDRLKIESKNFHDGVERFGIILEGTTLHKHSTISEYAVELEPAFFTRARKFTIVRNPWERAISFYFFHPKVLGPRLEGRPMIESRFDPDAFQARVLRTRPIKDHICIHGKSIEHHAIDRFLRTESLQTDMNAYCLELGMPDVAIARRNVGHHRHYTEYYTPDLRRAVGERFAEEIEYFGFRFD